MIKVIWMNRNKKLHNKENSEARNSIDDIFAAKHNISNRCMSHNTGTFFKKYKHTVNNMKVKRKQRWMLDSEEMLAAHENQSKGALQFSKYFGFRDSG